MQATRDNEQLFLYHEATKHTVERLRRTAHVLDWANMPEPFRHYEGVPLIDLPADIAAPGMTALEVLRDVTGPQGSGDWLTEVSRLLFYSASISASKRAPTGYRYALRVNPSSGNLHPTEFHLATRGGLYHYRVSSHMLEQRGTGDWVRHLGLDAPLAIVLTSIVWREAWKYRERAYRYSLHDIGHAAEALRLSALALGFQARIQLNFSDDRMTEALGVTDEWPMAIALVGGFPEVPGPGGGVQLYGGQPNQLSEAIVPYPAIEEMHEATKSAHSPVQQNAPDCTAGSLALLPRVASTELFGTVVRRRRSALDFRGGVRQISYEQFSALLDIASTVGDLVHLYVFVHRVAGLEPGLYRHCRNTLEPVRTGDQRVVAAALSLSQDLAGNSCVTFSMVANLQRAAAELGSRGYRYALIEAGRIGQRLYVTAEALGFQATGIGAFYDDQVHSYIGIEPAEGQVVYHFACGYAVTDDRLNETV